MQVEVEQRQWHLNAKRSVEGVGIAIDAIERRAAASAAQQKHLADASRTSALHRKTEADDLARRHSVAEQADLERTALAKKRATNIFSVRAPVLPLLQRQRASHRSNAECPAPFSGLIGTE